MPPWPPALGRKSNWSLGDAPDAGETGAQRRFNPRDTCGLQTSARTVCRNTDAPCPPSVCEQPPASWAPWLMQPRPGFLILFKLIQICVATWPTAAIMGHGALDTASPQAARGVCIPPSVRLTPTALASWTQVGDLRCGSPVGRVRPAPGPASPVWVPSWPPSRPRTSRVQELQMPRQAVQWPAPGCGAGPGRCARPGSLSWECGRPWPCRARRQPSPHFWLCLCVRVLDPGAPRTKSPLPSLGRFSVLGRTVARDTVQISGVNGQGRKSHHQLTPSLGHGRGTDEGWTGRRGQDGWGWGVRKPSGRLSPARKLQPVLPSVLSFVHIQNLLSLKTQHLLPL